ncbi:CE1759 family FMN reductase [Actinomyces slackii]|uniref:FMN reductase (NADPH) n=1 Tax=Actinomyces slackii TaxID=52774 RepID=A0A448KFM5_9ACTO|nr:CE1759 family FMN reductase [Actinomyces slackii]VEG75743.1 FMN reductase (NADPH) [Actinomyces slackii]
MSAPMDLPTQAFAPDLQAAEAARLSAAPSPAPDRPLVAGEYGESDDAYDHTQMGRLTRIVAVHAGLGTPSTSQMLAERLAESARRSLEADSRLTSVEVIALRPLAGEIALASVGGPLGGELQAAVDALAQADGVVLVTPVFQASYTGLFKSFMDILPDGALVGMPVLMGATAGTARHSLVTEFAMRPLLTYLKARPTTLAVFAASEDFGAAWASEAPSEQREAPLGERIERAGAELAQAVASSRRQAPVDAMADFTPMDALLAKRG